MTNKQVINPYIGSEYLSFDIANKGIYLNKEIKMNIINNSVILYNKGLTQFVVGYNYDPYPSIEKDSLVTRNILKNICINKQGLSIITSSSLILRDIDILLDINSYSKVKIFIKLFSLDDNKLINSNNKDILKCIKVLKDNELDVSIIFMPFPFINDEISFIDDIVNFCLKNNIKRIMSYKYSVIVKDEYESLVYDFLDKNYSGIKRKYISLKSSEYFIKSPKEDMISSYIDSIYKKTNIVYHIDEIIEYMFKYDKKYIQLSLF